MKTMELTTAMERLVISTLEEVGLTARVRSVRAIPDSTSDITKAMDITFVIDVEAIPQLKWFGLSEAAAGRKLRDSFLHMAARKLTKRRERVKQKRKRLKWYYRKAVVRLLNNTASTLLRDTLTLKPWRTYGACSERTTWDHTSGESSPLSCLGENSCLTKAEISRGGLIRNTKHAREIANKYITNRFSTDMT